MDTFDHEDPNNRPEEIPMHDLNNYQDDDDVMETTFSGGDNHQHTLADDIDINYNDEELQKGIGTAKKNKGCKIRYFRRYWKAMECNIG